MDGLVIVCCNRLLFFCEVVESTEEEGANAVHPDTIARARDRKSFIVVYNIILIELAEDNIIYCCEIVEAS